MTFALGGFCLLCSKVHQTVFYNRVFDVCGTEYGLLKSPACCALVYLFILPITCSCKENSDLVNICINPQKVAV